MRQGSRSLTPSLPLHQCSLTGSPGWPLSVSRRPEHLAWKLTSGALVPQSGRCSAVSQCPSAPWILPRSEHEYWPLELSFDRRVD